MFKKSHNKHQKQVAFTFVEVLVATMLTAFVMTAFGSMMALSMRVAEANEMEQLAQLKAQQVMEFFRRERLVRGWNTFFNSLENDTYCLIPFPPNPDNISSLNSGECSSGNVQKDFNFFFYTTEAVISKNSTANAQTVSVVINIYRYNSGGTLIGDDAFFTAQQTFKQY